MILSIHDFPIRYEDNCIKNRKGEIILNFSKRLQREKVIQFIIDSVPAINDGKRVYKKRLTKTLDKSLEESIEIVKQEMFEQGFIPSKGISDVEYNIISKEGNQKINFNKISINMENNKKDVEKNLEGLLVKLLDAKTQENLTTENKETALKDLIKLLNLYWENAKQDASIKGGLNKHQEVWFTAITAANKKAKYPLISITSGLFRCYIITLFGSIGEENLLKQLTGWSTEMLQKEKFTYDMKVLFLSINQIIQNKEKEEKEKEAEKENINKEKAE